MFIGDIKENFGKAVVFVDSNAQFSGGCVDDDLFFHGSALKGGDMPMGGRCAGTLGRGNVRGNERIYFRASGNPTRDPTENNDVLLHPCACRQALQPRQCGCGFSHVRIIPKWSISTHPAARLAASARGSFILQRVAQPKTRGGRSCQWETTVRGSCAAAGRGISP